MPTFSSQICSSKCAHYQTQPSPTLRQLKLDKRILSQSTFHQPLLQMSSSVLSRLRNHPRHRLQRYHRMAKSSWRPNYVHGCPRMSEGLVKAFLVQVVEVQGRKALLPNHGTSGALQPQALSFFVDFRKGFALIFSKIAKRIPTRTMRYVCG